MRELTASELERLETHAQVAEVAFQMDEQAFCAFYDRTARPLWAYLSRITGDRGLADDLLQETYYRFLRAGRIYDSDAHRRNSLFLIATNLATDHRRRPFAVALPDADRTPALQVDGDAGDRAACRTDVHRALSHLKPRERSLLWLAYAHGATHREIAEVLGLKTASIKLLLFRARRKLAAVLRGSRS
jgi:RNA polymerase sigma-70 factor, ECF subfamily